MLFFSNGNIKAVITTGNGRFYSNGLDLDWLASQKDPEIVNKFLEVQMSGLMKRIMTFPLLTVAAVNGID